MTSTSSSKSQESSYFLPLMVIGLLFATFGFITWTNGSLIPFLKIACQLTDQQALMVTFAFYISYTVLAIPSSFILRRIGFKMGMVLGLGIVAIGSIVFLPAANTRNFALFLTGLFVQGLGLSLLQTAVNPYVSLLGPIESAAKRISIMGICNKVAGLLAPIIMGQVILGNADALQTQLSTASDAEKDVLLQNAASSVNTPYLVLSVLLVIIALFISRTNLPAIQNETDENNPAATARSSVFAYPNLVLGFFALFIYVGAEVVAGDTIGLYGQNQGISLDEAKYFTAYTLAAMVVGYVVGIFTIPKMISQQKALAVSAIIGVVFSIMITLTSGYTSVLFIALLGLANSLMWPAIFPLSINGLGKFTAIGSAILVMGIAGGAILPQLYGLVKESVGDQQAYWIMVPCYLYILYFALAGHQKKQW
jgi:MFS transporter, FHS family, L-fucose permease